MPSFNYNPNQPEQNYKIPDIGEIFRIEGSDYVFKRTSGGVQAMSTLPGATGGVTPEQLKAQGVDFNKLQGYNADIQKALGFYNTGPQQGRLEDFKPITQTQSADIGTPGMAGDPDLQKYLSMAQAQGKPLAQADLGLSPTQQSNATTGGMVGLPSNLNTSTPNLGIGAGLNKATGGTAAPTYASTNPPKITQSSPTAQAGMTDTFDPYAAKNPVATTVQGTQAVLPNQSNIGTQPNSLANTFGLGDLSEQQQIAMGLKLSPAQEQLRQQLTESTSRLGALKQQLIRAQAPDATIAALNTQEAQLTEQLNQVRNPFQFLKNNPTLADVGGSSGGVTENQLEGKARNENELGIQQTLNTLLVNKSLLSNIRSQNIANIQTSVSQEETAQQIAQALASLQQQGQVLPEAVRNQMLAGMTGANISPQINEYNQALQRGLIPKGTSFEEAQFMLHPEQRFAQEMILNPATGLPEMHMIDKLQALRQSKRDRSNSPVSTPVPPPQPISEDQQQINLKIQLQSLPPTEKDTVYQMIDALTMAKDLEPIVNKITSGLGIGAAQEFLQGIPFLGNIFSNSDFNKFTAKITDFKANYLKAIGGARALSPQEQALFEKVVPSSKRVSKVNVDSLKALSENLIVKLKNRGIDIKKFPNLIPAINSNSQLGGSRPPIGKVKSGNKFTIK